MTHPVSRRAALPALALAITSTFASTFVSSVAHAGNAGAPAIASVLVTATRAPQAAADILSDHVLISSDDIARSGAGNVIDLLQKQRGIEVARNGGPGTNASVFIRGGDSKQTLVLVDGVRIGSSTTGIAAWSTLPLANIDRIEIIYGPLATMYGADAIGGVVQLFTKRGAGAPRVSFAAGAGSDKARSADASVSGGAGGISYALTAAREQDEGFTATLPGNFSYNPDHDGYTKESISGQLGMTLAPGHEAGILYLRSDLDAQYDNGAGNFDARGVQRLQNIAVHSTHQFTPAWRMKLQLSRADDKSTNAGNAGPTGTTSLDTVQTAASVQTDVAFGADLFTLIVERRNEEVASSSNAALSRERDTKSGAVAYSMKRGAHLASVSARLDKSSQYGSNDTWGVGYGYRITRALRAGASMGSSFRAPTFNELYFPNFGVPTNRPEHGRNAEASLVYSDGATEATAVYYRNRLTDLLVNTPRCPVDPAAYRFGCAYNVNRATLSGLSLGARTRVGPVDLSGSVDIQDPRDETTDKQLVRRARRHASLGAEYNAGALTAGIGVHASGKRFEDTANKVALGGYGVVNLFAAYRFAPDWSAEVRFNNVGDKRYELARYYATAGSQVFAGVRYGVR